MTKSITNRDLLRNYSRWRKQLESGHISSVEIPQSSGVTLKITVHRKMTPIQKLTKMIKMNPLKGLKRPTDDII